MLLTLFSLFLVISLCIVEPGNWLLYDKLNLNIYIYMYKQIDTYKT